MFSNRGRSACGAPGSRPRRRAVLGLVKPVRPRHDGPAADWLARPAGHREAHLLEIYVDADGCPVKDEIYRVAGRYGLKVWVVAGDWLRVPEGPLVTRVTVGEGLDRADDWIAERVGPGDIAITADVPLAARCVRRGARAIAPNGRAFTVDSIGTDLAGRNLMTALREAGEILGGGRPFTRQDRSRFLGALDNAIQAIKRSGI